ncbi:hypothetical protein [Glutamicibacter sp. NPDC087344]|uniref:hypothetical protein n=1 Tax=Glutamicibacter sp. NPDC087344 TaxID=3363994 RepID=UPI003825C9C6
MMITAGNKDNVTSLQITLLMGKDVLEGYPKGSRLFVRREPLHPGSRQARKQARNQDTLFTPALEGSFR